MVDGFDITAMAVTAHQIGEEMQLGEEMLGLVFSFSLAGMMLGAMLLASFSDVIGRRSLIILTLLAVGVSVALTAFADSFALLIVLRFISGLGAGAMLASVATLAAEYSPEKFRALSVVAVTAGYPLGAMVTGLTASTIVPEFGWRGMFIAGGAITLVLAGIALWLIPESLQFLCKKRPPGALDRVNSILIRLAREPVSTLPTVGEEQGDQEADTQHIVQKMLALLAPQLRRSTLILWCAFFLCISTLYFMMSWVPKLIINLGYTPEAGNMAFATFNFGGVLGILSLGYLASRWRLSALIALFAVIAAIMMCVFAGAASINAGQSALIVLIFVIGFSLQGGYTGLYAVAAKVYPVEVRSTGVGWAIGLGRLGAVVGPGIAGYMIASGVPIATNVLTFAVPMLIGGILSYQLRVS
ncbi:MAG: MFS transporter [Pseudomonadales bacterium]